VSLLGLNWDWGGDMDWLLDFNELDAVVFEPFGVSNVFNNVEIIIERMVI